MMGVPYYYSVFQREFDAYDASVGREFKEYSRERSPREVFLWLEKRRLDGCLPPALAALLTDFYWEIA